VRPLQEVRDVLVCLCFLVVFGWYWDRKRPLAPLAPLPVAFEVHTREPVGLIAYDGGSVYVICLSNAYTDGVGNYCPLVMQSAQLGELRIQLNHATDPQRCTALRLGLWFQGMRPGMDPVPRVALEEMSHTIDHPFLGIGAPSLICRYHLTVR